MYYAFNQEPYITKAWTRKSFAKFAEDIEKDWLKNDDNYNEKIFKDMIAQKILFNSTDRIIKCRLVQGNWV